jgi:hypothetical protein
MVTTGTLRIHERIVAALHCVLALAVVAFIAVFWKLAADLAPLVEGSFIPGLVAWIGRPIAIFFLVIAAIQIAAAIALIMQRGWGRGVLVAASFPLILLFPVGTLLAGYTFFALLWLSRNEPPRAPGQSVSQR